LTQDRTGLQVEEREIEVIKAEIAVIPNLDEPLPKS